MNTVPDPYRKAASADQSANDLRYSLLEQPSMLRPLGTGAAIGAGLLGTLAGIASYRRVVPRWHPRVRYAVDQASSLRGMSDAFPNTEFQELHRSSQDALAALLKRRKAAITMETGLGALGGAAGGALLGGTPGFAIGMHRERKYEDAIKNTGITAYEKAAEVLSGDPDEGVIDVSAKDTHSRVGLGAMAGALALGVPTAALTHRVGSKALRGIGGLRQTLGAFLEQASATNPELRERASSLLDEAVRNGNRGGKILSALLRDPLPVKLPRKYPALLGTGAGVVGAGAGALTGAEYDYGEARSLGRTPVEKEVRGKRLRRIGLGLGGGLALGTAAQVLKARKGPPLLDLMDFVPGLLRNTAKTMLPPGSSTKIPHPLPNEIRALRAVGVGAAGATAGLGYDMGVRSGYDDQESEYDTETGNQASPMTPFNVAGPVLPFMAHGVTPVPSLLLPSKKTMAIAGGIGGIANMAGRLRGRSISTTSRGAEKISSASKTAVTSPTSLLNNVNSESQDLFTDGMDDKSRRRRLAELLKRREATGSASGSASPNPPQEL